MVDREHFDEWLRAARGRRPARCAAPAPSSASSATDDGISVRALPARATARRAQAHAASVRARCVIGADGARSEVARQMVPGAEQTPSTSSPITRSCARPRAGTPGYDAHALRRLLPRRAVARLLRLGVPARRHHEHRHRQRRQGLLAARRGTAACAQASRPGRRCETLRREGAPIPLKPLTRWDNGRDVVLAGDAAGVVAPASGEGIYYAMVGGRLAAEAVHECLLQTGDAARAGAWRASAS